jgi:hypothetical protein
MANITKYSVSSRWNTREGDAAIVTRRIDRDTVAVTFSHPNTPLDYEQSVKVSNLRTGGVKNPYFPTVYGVGYIGKSKGVLLSSSKTYIAWMNMLRRCYCEKFKRNNKTYEHAACVREWHDMTNFADWFEENYRPDYELDKDILVRGNKLYGPDTCCFVPQAINSLLAKSDATRGALKIGVFLGEGCFRAQLSLGKEGKLHLGCYPTEEEAYSAYKREKEYRIKLLAADYYARQYIGKRVFLALINYEVNEND